jgi:hypothetical protein
MEIKPDILKEIETYRVPLQKIWLFYKIGGNFTIEKFK